MTLELTESELSELRQILSSPVLQKSIDYSLAKLWKEKRGANTIDGAAMAYSFQLGTTEILEELYGIVKIKREPVPNPGKLRHH